MIQVVDQQQPVTLPPPLPQPSFAQMTDEEENKKGGAAASLPGS